MTDHQFLLQRVQPAMIGLIDGSLSTLAPIFAIALHTHDTQTAFIAGVATAIVVVAVELVVLAWLRWRFFDTSFARSFASITLAGAVIAGVSAALGTA